VVENGRLIRSNIVASQSELHAQYGGVFPEAASRRTPDSPSLAELRGQREIVVKPIDGARGAASCFSGATILGDGVPALILEATSLL